MGSSETKILHMKRGEDYHSTKISADRATKMFAAFGYGASLPREYVNWTSKYRRFELALRKGIGELIDRDCQSQNVLRIGFGSDIPEFRVTYFGPIEDWALIRLRFL